MAEKVQLLPRACAVVAGAEGEEHGQKQEPRRHGMKAVHPFLRRWSFQGIATGRRSPLPRPAKSVYYTKYV